MLMRSFLLAILMLLLIFPVFAQFASDVVPVSAANINRLQSIAQIDFADLGCDFGTGWFVLNHSGEFIASMDNHQNVYLWNHKGELLVSEMPSCEIAQDVSGLAFNSNNQLFVLRQLDNTLTLSWQHPLDDIAHATMIENWDAQILDVWVDSASGIWLDVYEDDLEVIINIPNELPEPDQSERLPYAPAQDPDAIVRIGRIPPPYTVTSSREGIVKLWNIQTGQVVYEVDNGTGEAAVFGAINQAATHFVWRDSRNESLYLLNFETGENRYLANLNGQYAQWYFLSNDASAVIAVNLGFEPNVVVWDIATGEQTVLGEYRQCGRPQPDMARLSADGTTLVIGCDTGLDIWRIVAE
jgi:WD40 repeat protein